MVSILRGSQVPRNRLIPGITQVIIMIWLMGVIYPTCEVLLTLQVICPKSPALIWVAAKTLGCHNLSFEGFGLGGYHDIGIL